MESDKNFENRQFVRHPTEIPIEIWKVDHAETTNNHEQLNNISLGGLAFRSQTNWSNGDTVGIRIPLIDPPFEIIGKVVWCRERQKHYEVGVQFLEKNELFKVYLVEQICQIERYRKMVEKQGRNLTAEEAAVEWVKLYGAYFSP